MAIEKQKALAGWLKGRAMQWRRIEAMVANPNDRKTADIADILELVRHFRSLGRDLSLSRTTLPDNSPITRYLESLFLRSYEIIYRTPQNLWSQMLTIIRDDIPQVVRELRGNIFAVVGLFVSSVIVGWLMIFFAPELISLFAAEEMIRSVHEGGLWTDGLLNIMPSSVLAVGIMSNNIMVSLFAFCLGALYGLGTIYIICMNGLMLGGVFAFTAEYGLDGRLFEFIIAHGIVELSIICLAGAAGIHLGEAIIRPGLQSRTAAFQLAISKAVKLLLVCIPFLIGAGIIEGYISPDPDISLPTKTLVGVSYGILLWLVLSGKIWNGKSDN